MRKYFSVVLVTTLLVINLHIPSSSHAQDGGTPPLTQLMTLENEAGRLTIQFPATWQLTIPETIELPYAVIDNRTDTTLPTVVVEAIITSPEILSFKFDTQAENPAEAYFEVFKQQRSQEQLGVYGRVLPVLFGPSLDPFPGAMMMLLEKGETNFYLDEERVISLGVGIAVAKDTLLLISFQTSIEAFEGWRPTWLAMLDTLAWNEGNLMNSTTRTRTANLENAVTMASLYNTQFPEFINPAVPTPLTTSGNPLIMRLGNDELRIFTPLNWHYRQEDTLIVLTPVNTSAIFIAVRLVPTGADYGTIDGGQSPIVSQLQLGTTLVKQVREIIGGSVNHLETFDWGGFPAAGITYGLLIGTHQIRYVLALEGGFLEITLQASQSDWQRVKFDFEFLLSALTLNGTLIDSEAAKTARQSLTIQ